jgi:hypothetical protein
MKKLLAIVVASVFALGSLSSFAVGEVSGQSPAHQTVVKKHKVKHAKLHKAKQGKHKRHSQHKRTSRAS